MNEQDPEILTLLGRMNQWWTDNPFYIVRMETKGQFMDTMTMMYYFMDSSNRRLYRGETWTTVPFQAHFIFQTIDNVAYVQFPETKEFVANGAVIVFEAYIQSTLGALTQENVLLKASKLRELREVGGQRELRLVMDPRKLGVGPASADIELTIRYDDKPRVTSFDQIRMGLKQTTTFTYLTTKQSEVLPALPQLPPVEQVSPVANFDEALKRNMLYFRNLRTTEV